MSTENDNTQPMNAVDGDEVDGAMGAGGAANSPSPDDETHLQDLP